MYNITIFKHIIHIWRIIIIMMIVYYIAVCMSEHHFIHKTGCQVVTFRPPLDHRSCRCSETEIQYVPCIKFFFVAPPLSLFLPQSWHVYRVNIIMYIYIIRNVCVHSSTLLYDMYTILVYIYMFNHHIPPCNALVLMRSRRKFRLVHRYHCCRRCRYIYIFICRSVHRFIYICSFTISHPWLCLL